MSTRFFEWTLQRRAWLLLGAALLLIPLLLGALRARLDFDVERYFPDGDVEIERLHALQDRFGASGPAILTWRQAGGFSDADLPALASAARIFEAEGLEGISWIGSVMRRYALDSLEDLFEDEGDNPLYEGLLWSADRETVVFTGRLPAARDHDDGRRALNTTLTAALASLEMEGRTLTLNGEPILRARYLEMMAVDQVNLIGGGVLLTFLIMLLVTRSVAHSLLTLAAVIPAYLLVLTVLALTGRPVTAVMSMLPIILLVVGLSDTIHILTPLRAPRGEVGWRAHIARTFAEIARPCLFTSSVTALSFATLVTAGVGIIVDFALATALGIWATFAFSMLLFPPLLSLQREKAVVARPTPRAVTWLLGLGARRPKQVLALFTLSAAAAAAFAPQTQIEGHILNDLHDGAPLKEDLRRIEKQGFGVFRVNIVLDGARAPLSPELLDFNDEIARFARAFGASANSSSSLRLGRAAPGEEKSKGFIRGGEAPRSWPASRSNSSRTTPQVIKALTLNDFIGEALNLRGIPFTAQTRARLDFSEVEAALREAGRDGDGPRLLYDPETGSSQILLFVEDVGSEVMRPLLAELDALARRAGGSMAPHVTGTVWLTERTYAALVGDFTRSLGVAVVMIFAMLWLVGRSLPLALLGLIPNFYPLLALLGVIGATGYTLSPVSLLIFTVAFGLVVNDTVHILSRVALARRAGREGAALIHEVMAILGKAIMTTTLVLAVGFVVMTRSAFQTIFDMGFLIPTALVFALLADVILLPALYITAGRWVAPPAPRAHVA
ncbi:MMPL family transporter [Myxococcota bacterium]|nr:MMPL family transporter [Myxococcota bacterium]MBU1431426.1 MMPL family transporter [Myxococcota bacterium]MBU1898878.1 MMPL family transporter [Myxococcota bacterium]